MYLEKRRVKDRKWSHEIFSGRKQKRKLWDWNHWEVLDLPLLPLKGAMSHPASGNRTTSGLQSTRKQGLWSYNHMELNSANNLNKPRNRFFPRASRNESSSANTLFWPCETQENPRSVPGFLTQKSVREEMGIILGCEICMLAIENKAIHVYRRRCYWNLQMEQLSLSS